MQRRPLLKAVAVTPAALALLPPVRAAQAPPGVLRVAFNIAPTGFDPPQVSDGASVVVNAHIFEPPFTYDPLARPVRIVPLTAAKMPEASSDLRRFIITLRPGILFADDAAFKGRARELVAADYVFSLKRYYDPRWKSEHLYQFEGAGPLGLSELRQRALKSKLPFDYDSEVEGLRALDRYRFEVRLATPAPRLAYLLAEAGWASAVAREVVERWRDDDLMAHPVGTGPFMLHDWRRGSRVVLVRNPRHRERRFEAEVPAGDAPAAATFERLRGRRLPLIERIEADVIEEAQPRWLAFANGEHDVLDLPAQYAPLAVPNGELAPYLARGGVRALQLPATNITHTFFNCDDALVGGYTPERVALRRAIALACDNAAMVQALFNGQAQPAMSMIPPLAYGHDPALVTEMGAPSLARARALLDLYGYLDRNRDGWRETPDGKPLVLRLASRPDQEARSANDLWARRMRAIGLRMRFEVASFGELIKRDLAGQLMMWSFTWGGFPDGDFYLGLAYGPNAQGSNDAHFRLAAFDRLHERQRSLPDGPERLALMRQAMRLMLAYMPYIPHYHRRPTLLLRPRVKTFVAHPFRFDWGLHAQLSPGGLDLAAR